MTCAKQVKGLDYFCAIASITVILELRLGQTTYTTCLPAFCLHLEQALVLAGAPAVKAELLTGKALSSSVKMLAAEHMLQLNKILVLADTLLK